MAGLAVRRGQLLFKLRNLLLVLHQRFDARHRGTHARLHHVFGELFLVEDHDFFHVAHAALQVLAQRHNLANHDRRTRNRLQHAHLAALDTLGNLHFAFARQQRHGAHLAQIHAHGVVGLFQGSRGQVELDILAVFQFEIFFARELRRVQQIDALAADRCHQIVHVVCRAHLFRHHVVHVAVGEIALFLTGLDKVGDIVFEFLVGGQCNPALSAIFQYLAPCRATVAASITRAKKASQ